MAREKPRNLAVPSLQLVRHRQVGVAGINPPGLDGNMDDNSPMQALDLTAKIWGEESEKCLVHYSLWLKLQVRPYIANQTSVKLHGEFGPCLPA